MAVDKTAQRLHVRKTRGEALTDTEKAQLDAWYEQQDEAEARQLAAPTAVAPSLETLRAEVSEALTRLQQVTGRVQAQFEANEALRRENAALTERLARTKSQQAT